MNQAVTRVRHPILHRAALIAVLLLAAALHLYRLDQADYNLYYAATVKSMLTSWHDFFYASFDPGGFVTVDKPPLGLWIQVASATLLGLSGVSLILPQAIAGILSVALLYYLVSRVFGPAAGLIAALTLTVTPISIAANRNNTMDGLLVLTSLLAAWAASRAVEQGRLRWLVACVVLVGIGFNIKMLQAVMVLPAFYVLYLVAAPILWWKRLVHLALATVILIVVSLAWVAAVDWTPADQRPFIGSSQNNTEMELIVGHNGLARLGQIAAWLGLRRAGGPPAPQPGAPQPGQAMPPAPQPGAPPPGQAMPPAPQPGAPPPGQPAAGPNPPQRQPGGPNDETGTPGVWRLFNQQLAGQASWLLPLALLSVILAAWQVRLQWPLARQHQALILWTVWLVPQVVFFSGAGLFHRYYLEMLAPAIAALVGAGLVLVWNDYERGGWRSLLLPFALVGSAVIQVTILSASGFSAWSQWLTPLVLGLAASSAFGLIVIRFRSALRSLALASCIIGVLALHIAPAAWAITPLMGGDSGLPFAGPELLARRAPRAPNAQTDNRLVDYLRANRGGARFLVAAINANTAAPIILTTGEAVMTVGGFGGNDRILSIEQLAARVRNNDVRFFLLPQQGGQQAELVRWVNDRCVSVPPQQFSSLPAPRPGGPPQPNGDLRLFDCARVRP